MFQREIMTYYIKIFFKNIKKRDVFHMVLYGSLWKFHMEVLFKWI